ncbi:aldose 1-epimerase family protein [Luteimicrobium xylanilyticum]|uniref:Aldose 1-epimerase n=1 Tax=Luteimicrobium xylanilyticum TaxID=1133546 RepID=A0A5P9Q6Y2_9MICO|nr:aldose 1-epimerase family protein [Luteimicrobium xylanilyticum]QFU97161.1 hypothetical protein KDY119_00655 [Luteimicrobium xylanilyticum]
MSELHGLALREVGRRVGSLDQVARIEDVVDANGPARGNRRLRLVNGGGLELDVLPDRALDLGTLTFNGVPFAWRSAVGDVDPAMTDARGRGWMRTFAGGVLSTCGLDTFGAPSTDQGVDLPMHGRIGGLRSTLTRAELSGDELVVEGRVRQTAVLEENLVLRRRITTALGSRSFTVEDVVTNEGADEQDHMVLYHVNLGWPLLDTDTRIEIGQASAEPRDADAALGFDTRGVFGDPQAGFREQVFIHTTDESEQRVARVVNDARGLALTLRYSDTLPAIFEWKMLAERCYALGLEPANTSEMTGRAAARKNGLLPSLAPGESRTYRLEIEVDAP